MKWLWILGALMVLTTLAIVVLVVPTRRMIWLSLSSGWLRTSHTIALGRLWRRGTGV